MVLTLLSNIINLKYQTVKQHYLKFKSTGEFNQFKWSVFLKNVNSGQLSRSSHSQKSSKGQTQGCQHSQSLLMPPPLPDLPLFNVQDAAQLQTCGRLSRGTKSSCHPFPLLPKRRTPLQYLGLVPQQRQGCSSRLEAELLWAESSFPQPCPGWAQHIPPQNHPRVGRSLLPWGCPRHGGYPALSATATGMETKPKTLTSSQEASCYIPVAAHLPCHTWCCSQNTFLIACSPTAASITHHRHVFIKQIKACCSHLMNLHTVPPTDEI